MANRQEGSPTWLLRGEQVGKISVRPCPLCWSPGPKSLSSPGQLLEKIFEIYFLSIKLIINYFCRCWSANYTGLLFLLRLLLDEKITNCNLKKIRSYIYLLVCQENCSALVWAVDCRRQNWIAVSLSFFWLLSVDCKRSHIYLTH